MANLTKLMQEDTPLTPIPAASKQSWLFLAGVMVGCTICVPVFVMGATLAHQLPYQHFVMAALLGGILATFIALLTGFVGQKTGLPTAMLAKIAFGTHGYILANGAMAIAAIGWFGIQISVFSNAFTQLAHQVWGLHFNQAAVSVIAGFTMSSTAVIGFRGLGKLSYIAVPLLIIVLILPLYSFYVTGQLANVAHSPRVASLSLGAMVAIVAGAYSFATTMPDITRFMQKTRGTILGIVTNFTVAYPLLLILTGTVALAANQTDYMQIMIGLGFGALTLIALFLATWTTNDTNIYAASLSLNLFLPHTPRWKVAIATGVVGTLFALFGIFEHFTSWLIFSGNLFSPMAGVYVADFWLNQKNYQNTKNIPTFKGLQLSAWLGGVVIGTISASSGALNIGMPWPTTTIPMVDAMLAAAFIQLTLHFLRKRTS